MYGHTSVKIRNIKFRLNSFTSFEIVTRGEVHIATLYITTATTIIIIGKTAFFEP
jgi:hypothetical protein